MLLASGGVSPLMESSGGLRPPLASQTILSRIPAVRLYVVRGVYSVEQGQALSVPTTPRPETRNQLGRRRWRTLSSLRPNFHGERFAHDAHLYPNVAGTSLRRLPGVRRLGGACRVGLPHP